MVAGAVSRRGLAGDPGRGAAATAGDRRQSAAPPARTSIPCPYPDRETSRCDHLGARRMPLLASRGCARTCSFCSIHTFYRTAPGKVVRLRRRPRSCARCACCHDERGITIFLFQDDDFPLFGPKWRPGRPAGRRDRGRRPGGQGLLEAQLPRRRGGRRAALADARCGSLRRLHGPGVRHRGRAEGPQQGDHRRPEPGGGAAAQGARHPLRLRLHAARPVEHLRVRARNIGFLRQIVGDGSASATFCKMLPYDGTPIKDALEAEGRLKGDVCAPTTTSSIPGWTPSTRGWPG